MKGMKYHDYIWDLGGTLLDNYETSTAAFVETLAEFGIEQEHDSVYEALKVSTAFAIEKYAPGIENFLEKYKENEARDLEHPVLFDGIPALLEEILDQGGRNFWKVYSRVRASCIEGPKLMHTTRSRHFTLFIC